MLKVLTVFGTRPEAVKLGPVILELARHAGDGALELEALQLTAQIAGERGEDTTAEWTRIEQLARESGEWETVAGAMRIRAAYQLDDEPDHALPQLAAASDVALAHGLLEATGWKKPLSACTVEA